MDEENLHPRPMALMKSLRLDAQSGSQSAAELAVVVMVMVLVLMRRRLRPLGRRWMCTWGESSSVYGARC